MATPSELTNDGLMFAYFNNIDHQKALRARQKELEDEIHKRLPVLADKYKRGELEIKQKFEEEI